MHPEATSYQLLQSDDKKSALACKKLAKKWGQPLKKLDFPTVIAKRDGKIIGFISTLPRKDAVIAGPMVVDVLNAGYVVMRLMEAYERVLGMAGVTLYNIYVENADWSAIISRALGTKPVPHEGGYWHRRLIHGRESAVNTGAIGH